MKNSVMIQSRDLTGITKNGDGNIAIKKTYHVFASFILVIFILAGCSEEASYKVKVNGNDVIVCEVEKVTDTIAVQLSSLVESYNMVILENSTEALIGTAWHTVVTDDYIAINGRNQVPVKLFGTDGRFLGEIGTVGRGPGEYIILNGIQFSYKGDMLNLLPFGNTNKIMVYDIWGNHVMDIPLAYTQRKFKASFLKDSVITIFSMPFETDSVICYQQDYHGKVLGRVDVPDYLINYSFDGEVFSNLNDNNDFFNTATDTLYNYDVKSNNIVPRFTKDFGGMKAITLSYEIPEYFYFYYNIYSGPSQRGNILVNKKTLESNYFKIENNFFGGIEMTNYFNNGWFINNVDAFTLKNKIKTALENNDMDESMRKKLVELDNSLEEGDNNIVFYGKLKK